MSFRLKLEVLAFSIFIAIASSICAQTANKSGPKYDPTKEIKIKGTVTEVKEFVGGTEPTLLIVKAGDKTTTVRLAPAEFLKEIDCWIKAGDQVEVVGAKAPDSAQDEILAREVIFGNNTMVLRDSKGVPVWEVWKPTKSGG
jgi:hypothetical protein